MKPDLDELERACADVERLDPEPNAIPVYTHDLRHLISRARDADRLEQAADKALSILALSPDPDARQTAIDVLRRALNPKEQP